MALNSGFVAEESLIFVSNAFEDRSRLWTTRNKDCDVNVICRNNEKIPAHKTLLAASSQIFHAALIIDDKELKLPGVDRKYMERLINFVYCGRVVVPASDGPKMIELARKLKIEGFHGEGNITEVKIIDTKSGIE
jgi:hypothetical protein